MWDQEKDHLKKFNELMVAFRVRPTILMPFWNVVGFALGVCPEGLMGAEGPGTIISFKCHFTSLAVPSYSLFLFT